MMITTVWYSYAMPWRCPPDFVFGKRFVDVTLRYGVHPATIDRWKKTLELKNLFEKRIGGTVYTLLPGVLENSFSLEVTV